MSYKHGIYGNILSPAVTIKSTASSGLQGIVGTAPVNLLDDPSSAVLKPLLLSSISNVKSKIGYSSDVDKFTLMQAVHASFEVFNVAPIIVVNVFDITKHATSKTASPSLSNGTLTVKEEGIVLSTLVVKSEDGATTYVKDTDYTAAFDSDGYVVITRKTSGAITSATEGLSLTYSELDVSKVTDEDVIAGIAALNKAYQALGYLPETLLAPGFSQEAAVAAALISEAGCISSVFKATAIVDIDSSANTTIAAAIATKTANSLGSKNAIVCYPKVITTDSVTLWMSAMLGALMEYTDSQNDNAPFVSPSNKAFNISGTVLADGTQELYSLDEANELNAEGIFTALRFEGWRSWGSNTGIYSYSSGNDYADNDRFISIKRAFDWQNNGFIRRYFDRIDKPMNLRAIQTLITDENQYYNGFITAGYVAGMSIAYNSEDNTTENLLKGILTFTQHIAPYIPTEVIVNNMQFDASLLETALSGGDSE